MITSADDLIATFASDAAMIASVAALYGLLRRGQRQMITDQITPQVTAELQRQLGVDHTTPREALIRLMEDSTAHGQQLCDLAGQVDAVSGRLQLLRGQFEQHLDRR